MTNQLLPQNFPKVYEEAINKNVEELKICLGIEAVIPMSIKDADQQSANPYYNREEGYDVNCQTCVPAFLLRLRGLDITAGKVIEGNLSDQLSRFDTTKGGKTIYHCWDCYANIDGSDVSPILFHDILTKNKWHAFSSELYVRALEEYAKEKGLYQMAFKYKPKLGNGHHIIALQRCENGELYYLDPQSYDGENILCPIKELVSQIDVKGFGGILRIDDKIIKKKYAKIFKK